MSERTSTVLAAVVTFLAGAAYGQIATGAQSTRETLRNGGVRLTAQSDHPTTAAPQVSPTGLLLAMALPKFVGGWALRRERSRV